MWRGTSASFGYAAHPFGGWDLLRHQLATACSARSSSEVPPLAVLALEVEAIAELTDEAGRLPYDAPADKPFRSLSRDLEVALGRLGRETAALIPPSVRASLQSDWTAKSRADTSARPPLLQAGRDLAEVLRSKAGVQAVVRDALSAAEREPVACAVEGLRPALDDLRALVEYQQRSWNTARSTITSHLTASAYDRNGDRTLGRFPTGTDAETILSSMIDGLFRPDETRRLAVWIATRGGPGGHADRSPAVVSGPVAVSGTTCQGDVGEWLAEVQAELAAAFQAEGLDVPVDVQVLGEGMHFLGEEVLSGVDLWRFAADPASFLARVEVIAPNDELGIELAKGALQATYGITDPFVAGDLRSDVRVWTESNGWHLPSATARGHGVGELFAGRTALGAVHRYGADLGRPLDPRKLERMRSRALVANADVSYEVRLMRAWSELEGLRPPGSSLIDIGPRLWLQTAWQDLTGLVSHIEDRIVDSNPNTHPREGVTAAEFAKALHRLKATWASKAAPQDPAGRLDACSEVLTLIDSECVTAALATLADSWLRAPEASRDLKTNHEAAFRRASRHRNLTMHGHRIPDFVLAPTVAFLARQLVIGIYGESGAEQRAAWSWMGSITKGGPDSQWERVPLREASAESAHRLEREDSPTDF